MLENLIKTKIWITINVDVSINIWKNMCAKKIIFGTLLHVTVKMVNTYKYVGSVIDDLVITRPGIMEETKNIFQQIFMKKSNLYKTKNVYILLAFLLVI